MKTLKEQFKAARMAGTPLIGINSFDPAATIDTISSISKEDIPIITWDIIRGWQPRNNEGEKAIATAMELGGASELIETLDPVNQLVLGEKLPYGSILIMHNAHQYFSSPNYIQALWNIRDEFKSKLASTVLLGPEITLPPELQQDILIIDEELPNREALRKIILSICKEAKAKCNITETEKASDALQGLAAFPAEQAVAMSLSKSGLSIDSLWDRKRALISSTPGLSVWKGEERFDDIGGLGEIKSRFKRIISGKKSPKVIVWIDEIEKAMAGTGNEFGDSSGTSQDQLGVFLSEMQDKNYSGSIFVGVPGAAKSAFAKAVANEAGVLTIRLDLGAMKGGLVGESEKNIRHAMKIIHAVGGDGGAFFIATSNDIRVIKPELKRRFRKGIYFFDFPDIEERQAIWKLYCKKFDLIYRPERIHFDTNWTGAEIESCVSMAWEEDLTFEEASKSIVPVSISDREQIDRLRKEAAGRYNSASYQGVYNFSNLTENSVVRKNGSKQQKRKVVI